MAITFPNMTEDYDEWNNRKQAEHDDMLDAMEREQAEPDYGEASLEAFVLADIEERYGDATSHKCALCENYNTEVHLVFHRYECKDVAACEQRSEAKIKA